MARSNILTRFTAAALGAALVAGACTTNKQQTPALSGPSELSTAISIAVTPDVLSQDGASQSLVTVSARDANGQPLRNLPLRAQITVNGAIADFGTLSARNLVTDTAGRATFTYTAPSAPAVSVDNGILVGIQVTPSGSDFANSNARTVTIRLVPPGVVGQPNTLNAIFAFSPIAPTEDTPVLFDAGASVGANPNATLVSYAWEFGGGGTASGRQVTRTFGEGSRTVRLTITDAVGRTGLAQQVVTVTATARPTAVISAVSPAVPRVVGQPLHFDASGSTAAPGHRIVSYTWNWGEGTVQTTGGARVDFVYTLPGSYNVLLTVTDETGKTSLPFPQNVVILP